MVQAEIAGSGSSIRTTLDWEKAPQSGFWFQFGPVLDFFFLKQCLFFFLKMKKPVLAHN